MTLSDLLAVVYRFYPRGILFGGPGYWETEEHQRLEEAVRRGAAEYPTWKAMIRRLGDRYRIMDRSMVVLTGGHDAAYSAYVVIPPRTLGFHVSLLGPYYAVHRTGAPGEEPAALDIAREIEATYAGHAKVPPEIGEVIVPDLCLWGSFGELTLYDCLFSEEWRHSSDLYDDTRSPDYVDPDAPIDEDEAREPAPDTELPIKYKDTWTRIDKRG